MSDDMDSQSRFSHSGTPETPTDSTPTPTSTPAPTPTPTPTPSPSPAPTEIDSRKRKLTSIVWKDFDKIMENGEDKAICHYCKSKLKANSKHGTSHLREHLKRCMKRTNVDIRQQLLSASLRGRDGTSNLGNHDFNQETSRNDFAKAIIVHEYPLSIVEHVAMRKFILGLEPRFKMVCRNTIKSDILKIYQSRKMRACSMFDKLESRVAITTDMWSSKQKKGYMAVTAHFVDENWKLQSMIIGFIYVPAPHTKEALCDALYNCLLDWNLDRKISTITVDNCTTNDALIDILIDKLLLSGPLLLDGKLLHMRCAAHVLNLVVRDGLDVIGGAIEKVRDSVVYWTATQGRQEKFEEAARQLRIPCKKKLAIDCKTRWNSTFLMLENALVYKDVFPRLRLRERHYTSLPSENDWSLAKEICGRLRIFYNVTELFSGTQYPTTNFLLPKICEVKIALCTWLQSEDEVIRNMATKMLEKFNKYWTECHLVGALAVIFDPRCKLTFLEHIFSKAYGSDSASRMEDVRKSCYNLLHEYQVKFNMINVPRQSVSTLSSRGPQVGRGGGVGEVDLFSEFLIIKNTSVTVSVKSELDYYLEEPVMPPEDDFDLLTWWKSNGVKYPTLKLIARDILAIPVSTVASESAFSTSGRVISPHRSRLGSEILEALMCSQDWIWEEFEGFLVEPTITLMDLEEDSSCSTVSPASKSTVTEEEEEMVN